MRMGLAGARTHRTKVPRQTPPNGCARTHRLTGNGGPGVRPASALRGTRPRIALAEGLEEEDGAGHGRVERADGAPHRDADEEVAAAPDRRAEPMALAADHDPDRAAQVRLARAERGLAVGAD